LRLYNVIYYGVYVCMPTAARGAIVGGLVAAVASSTESASGAFSWTRFRMAGNFVIYQLIDLRIAPSSL
jgi:hypothetical protein